MALDPRSCEPLFLQIARTIADDVRRGRLKPGARLPGSRDLAQTLGVHRNTVVAAYAELAAEGWTETAEAKGTFVSRAMPEVKARRFAARAPERRGVPQRAAFPLAPDPGFEICSRPGSAAFSMPGGAPDLRLVPTAALARAYRRVLRRDAKAVLGYGDPRGHPRMRAALAAMLSATRGLATEAEDVLVTRGSQMAIELIARTILTPGDVVVVENPGYRAAWQAFLSHGARLIPLPVDREGFDVEALRALTKRTRVRAVYLTPHHQYPTTVTLSAARRLALLDLARRERIAVIEDDYDHEFHYDGHPVLPLASADPEGVVIYMGTLAKILAPGLRIGYLVGPRDLLERAATERFCIDGHGDHTLECAVAEMLEDGEVLRHARRARRIYQPRRDFLVERLRSSLGDALSFEVPSGGLALWTAVAPDIDAEAWAARALELGVFFFAGRHFSFDRSAIPNARFGFAALNERELGEAVRRVAQALRDVRRRRGAIGGDCPAA